MAKKSSSGASPDARDGSRQKEKEKSALRRGDPRNRRLGRVTRGSEEQAGAVLLDVLKEEAPDGSPRTKGRVVYTDGAFWEYDKTQGLWVAVSDDELHRIVGSFDGTKYKDGKALKTLRVSNAFAHGAIKRASVRASVADFFAVASSTLVFTDTSICIDGTGAIEQVTHAASHHARAGYPFTYDPQAKAPRFRRMMEEHFEGDADAAEKIACMQEFFGACLLGIATRFQKCLALPSDGGSGRSTMLEVIEAAMPVDSVSHVDARDLRKAERRARLPGKRLCYSDEVPPDAFLDSEDFKRIVVGNVVTAEEKYRPSFEFRPICGLVFPIQITAFAELSDAFFRRFVIIRYNGSFEDSHKRDYNLAATIKKEELPGVVGWMIAGAARLLKRGKYAIPPSHEQEEARWKMTADTARAFLETEYTKALFLQPRKRGYGPDGKPNGKPKKDHDWTSGSELYAAYRAWCEENGHRKPVANPEFSRRISKAGYPSFRGSDGRFYYGVRSLKSAQKTVNSRAKRLGTPTEALKGAISILRTGPKLTLVKNSAT